MTPEEQFNTLNTPTFLGDFRDKVSDLWDALQQRQVHVPAAQFEVNGVPCNVVVMDSSHARAQIGTKDGGGWQFDVVAPIGWFRPA